MINRCLDDQVGGSVHLFELSMVDPEPAVLLQVLERRFLEFRHIVGRGHLFGPDGGMIGVVEVRRTRKGRRPTLWMRDELLFATTVARTVSNRSTKAPKFRLLLIFGS